MLVAGSKLPVHSERLTRCWLVMRRTETGPEPSEKSLRCVRCSIASLRASPCGRACIRFEVAASDEQIREPEQQRDATACSSPVPGSGTLPYPNAPLHIQELRCSTFEPAPMPCASRPPPRMPSRSSRRTLARLHRQPNQATSQPLFSEAAPVHDLGRARVASQCLRARHHVSSTHACDLCPPIVLRGRRPDQAVRQILDCDASTPICAFIPKYH